MFYYSARFALTQNRIEYMEMIAGEFRLRWLLNPAYSVLRDSGHPRAGLDKNVVVEMLLERVSQLGKRVQLLGNGKFASS